MMGFFSGKYWVLHKNPDSCIIKLKKMRSKKMKNPAKIKLVFSGLIDFIVAMFFAMMIAFTVYFLASPIFNVSSQYAAGVGNHYDVVIAKLFGGMSVLVATLFLATGLAFLGCLIFSLFYIKSCFSVARMELQDSKTKVRAITLHGITQVMIGIVAFVVTIYSAVTLDMSTSLRIIIIFDAAVGLAFLSTGMLKLAAAKSIKYAKVPTRYVEQTQIQPYQNYYYYN